MIPILRCYFYYGRDNYEVMDKCLQCVDWDALFSDNNVKKKCSIFKEVFDNAVSKFVPNSKRRTRQKQVWWTRGIEQARELKQEMWYIIRIQRTVILITTMRWP